MLAHLRSHYFLAYGQAVDPNKVTISDLNRINLINITVPNIEKQLEIKR